MSNWEDDPLSDEQKSYATDRSFSVTKFAASRWTREGTWRWEGLVALLTAERGRGEVQLHPLQPAALDTQPRKERLEAALLKVDQERLRLWARYYQ